MASETGNQTEEVARLVLGDYSLRMVMGDRFTFGNAPDEWAPQIDEALRHKARGEFVQATQILVRLQLEQKRFYTQLTDEVFEIQACVGLVKIADQYLCYMIDKLDQAALSHLVPVYQDKLRKFVAAFHSEPTLVLYLTILCRNVDYKLPMPYAELRAQLDEIMSDDSYAQFHDDLTKPEPRRAV